MYPTRRALGYSGVAVKAVIAVVRRFACGYLLLWCLVSMVYLTRASKAQEQPASKSAEPQQTNLVGKWGGQHLAASLSNKGASLEFDCAHGQFDKPLRPDRLGRFAVRGLFVEEHGGPILKGETPKSHGALYTGRVKGNRMTITVKLLDTRQQIGAFVVRQGDPARLFKCR